MISADVVVIGGGPAGMAAALAAEKSGASVMILERDSRLGGILNQCIHAGFGLHFFGEEMTGPEYADRFVKQIEKSNVRVLLNTMCLSLSRDRALTALSPENGFMEIKAGAVVLAMGCRERTAGAIALPGTRPAGIYTAGMAQKLSNTKGYLVGKKVVILGSGDIGLIMARRMTLEGAKVEAVLELMPYSAGLKRNIVQCLDDFSIPLLLSHTVTRVEGEPRLTGLWYAPVGGDGKLELQKEKYIACDALLLSVGLIPENDLLNGTGIEMSRVTSGAVADENRMTSAEGIFSCGNVLHVHDLVDNVSAEAETAGRSAGEYALGRLKPSGQTLNVTAENGVRYALPQKIRAGEGKVKIYYRVANVYKGAKLIVESGGKVILSKPKFVLAPGEMESVELDKSKLTGDVKLRLEI